MAQRSVVSLSAAERLARHIWPGQGWCRVLDVQGASPSRLDAVVEVHHAAAETALVQQLEIEVDIPG
jgi:hypothetical protein